MGQRQSPSYLNTKRPGSEGGVGGVQESRGHPTFTPRETTQGAGEHWCWDLEPVACWERRGSQSLAPVWGETPRDRDATESALGAAGRSSRGAWDRSGGRDRQLSPARTGRPPGEGIRACRGAGSSTTSERG